MKKILLLLVLTILMNRVYAQNKNIVQLGHLPFVNSELSNIWGYVDSLGNEYALVGLTGVSGQANTDACAIINVNNPTDPQIKFIVQGPYSIWREIRTWQSYAYITTEAADKTFGVTIVDLSDLPDSINTKQYTANQSIGNVHALHIDNGYLYLYGASSSPSMGGVNIISLSDPWNPLLEGVYNQNYVHDGFVKDNKIYAAEIYKGVFNVIDVTDKANPVSVIGQKTPSDFTHNTWLSTDGKYLYTTDEVPNAFVASYDVSDLNNIKELDRYQRPNAGGAIPHNTYVLNDSSVTGFNSDFLVTSYYTEGVTIVDASRPDNLIEVGNFDTSPLSGNDMVGAWGVYPYLPSGNLLVSDIEEGLFILKPSYVKGCYLEGFVKDALTQNIIPAANVQILGKGVMQNTNISGEFKMGIVDTGMYDVRILKSGYITQIIPVSFQNGQLHTMNVQMFPVGTGTGLIDVSLFRIYPSLVSDYLTVEYYEQEEVMLRITDIYGRVHKEEWIQAGAKFQVPMYDLSSGMYFVKLIAKGKESETLKIIKQ